MRSGDLASALVAVGAVTPASARIWLRTDRPGPHVIEVTDATGAVRSVDVQVGADADQTAAFTIDLAAPGHHRVRVLRGDGSLLGEGTFRAAPPTGERARVVFAAASCHQPFSDDGEVTGEARRMLQAAGRAIRDSGAAFFLLMGDQVYSDYPPPLSLFDEKYFATVAPPGRKDILACTREEVRALYQQRHRMFWAVDEFARLQTLVPTWTMLDDHEVADNCGSAPEHARPAWEALRQGALDAYHDYQASRSFDTPAASRPRTFHQAIDWGHISVFMLDVRSERRVEPDGRTRILPPEQVADLRRFLDERKDQTALFVMSSVPLVHIRSWAANLIAKVMGQDSDAADRWSHPSCVADRDMLFRILVDHKQRHPAQKLVLLGGDIHAGSALAITFGEGGPVVHQFTASALSNRENAVKVLAFELAARSTKKLDCVGLPSADVALLPGARDDAAWNPFGRLNLGLIEVDEDGGIVFRLVSATEEDPATPVVVYESVRV